MDKNSIFFNFHENVISKSQPKMKLIVQMWRNYNALNLPFPIAKLA
jgi:hypothetical protein